MKLSSMLWYAVPVALALPAAMVVARMPSPSEGLLCMVVGLSVTLARGRENRDGGCPAPGEILAGWGMVGWLGAVLAVAPSFGGPLWLAAIGWCLAWRAWLRAGAGGAEASRRQPLAMLLVPMVSFPWILYEIERLGWWFRLTGAAVARAVFGVLGFEVAGAGTRVCVLGVELAVDAACAGLGSLQAMVLAGAIWITALHAGTGRVLAGVLALLPLAWLANTARVLALGIFALISGPDAASGAWHEPLGWVVLMLVYGAALFALARCVGEVGDHVAAGAGDLKPEGKGGGHVRKR